MKPLTSFISLCLLFVGAFAQEQTGSLEGVVLDRASKQPLELVNVVIQGTNYGAATNANGRFTIHNIPVGTYTVKFSMIGFTDKLVSDVRIKQGTSSLDVLLEETSLETEEVVVTPKPERYDASGISGRLGKEMIAASPGSAQDIFWVIQTLPGIASDGDNSKLYVRGGSPDENLVLYDGATIRNPFHFDMMGGGYWSIFNARLVDKVEFYAGGFPARYGNRLSSVLLIENRMGSEERVKGELSLSMSDVSATLEAPLTALKGAAIFSARRSYFDALLKYTDLASEYSVLPYFFDLNSKLDFQLGRDHKLMLSALYSRERMYGYFDDNPHFTGNFTWENSSGIITGRLRSILSDGFLSDLILSWSRTKNSSFQLGDGVEQLQVEEVTIKQDFAFLSTSSELHIGGWLVHEREDVRINLPMEIAPNFDEMRLRGEGTSLQPSVYIDEKWKITPEISTSIGLRYDFIARSKEHLLAPRLNIAYAWNEHMSVSLDYGWYYQSPRAFELGLNKNLHAKRAESFGVGMKHEVSDAVVVNLELYNKNLSHLIGIDSLWNLNNGGEGYSRGAEVYIQLKDSKSFVGWLSYTYSLSRRKEGRNDGLHVFDFDRPHLISLVVNYALAEHWQGGVRFRYGSGRPYTPAASAWSDPNAGHWKPIPGAHNSDRYPAYSRLDLRVTRKLEWNSLDLDLYLELMNVLNRQNVIHYMWDEQYASKEAFTIFPFLPVVGITARF